MRSTFREAPVWGLVLLSREVGREALRELFFLP